MLNHEGALFAAVQVHPLGAVTAVDPLPPEPPTVWLVGAIVNVQAAAACETVKVWDAMVNVPVRALALGFAATVKPTDPLPLPLLPLVTVIQPTLAAADQGQPAPEVTLVEPAPPAAVTDKLLDAIANVQPTPACVTMNVWPPIVSVPFRWLVFGLADALNATVPLPLPLAPLVTVSQPVLLLTPVHAQPVGAVTLVDPVPPAAVTDWLAGAIANVQTTPA